MILSGAKDLYHWKYETLRPQRTLPQSDMVFLRCILEKTFCSPHWEFLLRMITLRETIETWSAWNNPQSQYIREVQSSLAHVAWRMLLLAASIPENYLYGDQEKPADWSWKDAQLPPLAGTWRWNRKNGFHEWFRFLSLLCLAGPATRRRERFKQKDHLSWWSTVPRGRFELPTKGLWVPCSATELPRRCG